MSKRPGYATYGSANSTYVFVSEAVTLRGREVIIEQKGKPLITFWTDGDGSGLGYVIMNIVEDAFLAGHAEGLLEGKN